MFENVNRTHLVLASGMLVLKIILTPTRSILSENEMIVAAWLNGHRFSLGEGGFDPWSKEQLLERSYPCFL